MGCRWLGLVFTLAAAAAPSCRGGGMPESEVPAAPCPQGESLQEEEQHMMPRFSTCMLQCAAQAMLGMVGAKATVSLKLNEGREGKEQEFCWMLHLRCEKGERLTKAFVLLNLEQPPDGGQPPPYRLLLTTTATTPPSPRQYLRGHHGNRGTRLLSRQACGIRFDVTEPFRSARGGQEAKMCVEAVCPEEGGCGALRLSLRCPPFLATLWRSLPRPDS
ncbi:uncharacterized protein LOC133374590 [Rhineura floridana]|uniref:uncharacterized protein LOC133374590 n=1 Tax=Rhineura floridana TaxID=261503 RepID=UPI002AC7F3A3|nr:uncharacterized protein LOC133374590 [Rhineura floridana]XP_061461618.1 uncharacterized protein LOC133374590 [Rhineura floridana]XP_061461619.1 uncharacterized protein LOC133374590 [Rhineura floridana]